MSAAKNLGDVVGDFAHIFTMNRGHISLRLFTLTACAAAICGCTTVKMPNLDALKLSNFKEEAARLEANTPNVGDAPRAPTDIRSDAEWDGDVRAMIDIRDDFVSMKTPIEPSDNVDVDAEFAQAKARVQAYKLDDPQE